MACIGQVVISTHAILFVKSPVKQRVDTCLGCVITDRKLMIVIYFPDNMTCLCMKVNEKKFVTNYLT